MTIISAVGEVPSTSAIDAAVKELEAGNIVAVPTDTAYGLVADVSYTGAADRLFKLKKRSRNHELPVIVSDVDQAMSLAIGVPPAAERLMEKFWPGALTLVLPRNPDFVADLGGDEDTIAIRCPDHIVPRLLCEEVGPLAVTTANTEGAQPAMTAQEVSERFGEVIAIVLDAGRCDRNLATVVDVTGIVPKLLREGQVAWVDIQDVLD